jgi:hypothetical protein
MSEETEVAPWVLVLVLAEAESVVPAFCAGDRVAIIWANRAAKVSFAEVVAWLDDAVFAAVVWSTESAEFKPDILDMFCLLG